MKDNILIIDDEDRFRELLARIIDLEGFKVLQARNIREGFKILENEFISVVVTDVKLPDGNGLSVLESVKKEYPLIEVIVITAFGNIQDGVKAMKKGAFDYITKGDEDEHIPVVVERAAEKVQMQSKIKHLQQRIESKYGFENIIGESQAIKDTIYMAQKVAPTGVSVLLQGETGTRKELFAQAIHQASPRKGNPFVAINCSAFPDNMLESELFGFKKGAFTGATESKKGLLEEADTGTLFLDEIAEMAVSLQAKLLRVLETQTFTKLGDTKQRTINIRIIAATNRDLKEEAEHETFRSDLYYRLAGFTISLPALRERTEDIPLLAGFFVQNLNQKVTHIDRETLALLENYHWKGNIRELKNVIERASILADGDAITPDLLPPELHEKTETSSSLSCTRSLKEVEKIHIQRVLEHCKGNKTKTAGILGIGTSTLYRKIEEYDL